MTSWGLAGGDDEVVTLVQDAAVDLDADRVAPESLGDLTDVVPRDLTQLDHVVPPVVGNEAVVGNVPEHFVDLSVRHGDMGPQSGHDVHQSSTLGQGVVVHIGDEARPGVAAGEVRGQDEDLFQLPSFDGFQQRGFDLLCRQTGFGSRDDVSFHTYTPE